MEHDFENLVNINADINDIPQIDDNAIDLVFMLNVGHGCKARRKYGCCNRKLLTLLKLMEGLQSSNSDISDGHLDHYLK